MNLLQIHAKVMGEMKKGKVLLYFTGVLLTLIGVGAVISGWLLMQDPSGDSIGLTVKLLENSPFDDYFIPGLVLFAVNGIGSLLVALLIATNQRYTGFATMVLGLAMIIWIVVEFFWVSEESFLQPTMFAVGLVEMILGFFITRQYTKNNRKIRNPLKPRSPRAGM
jgi:hypothetical protein